MTDEPDRPDDDAPDDGAEAVVTREREALDTREREALDTREREALDTREREALDTWTAPAPPDGFAARVLAARRGAPAAAATTTTTTATTTTPARRGRWLVAGALGGALAAALAAAAVVVITRPAPAPAAAVAGAHVAAARVELPLGRRGVAVAEAGATLAWQIAGDGAARVEQGAGDVFYRVEPGGSFVVTTPAGDVRVTGTCFRVEVLMKPDQKKPALAGAALGAALAATVVVTVYEGGVVAAGRDGREHRAAAGDQLALGADGAVAIAAAAPAPAPVAPPPDGVTRDQLLARDAEQRGTIDQLVMRVAGLEAALAEARLRGGDGAGGPAPVQDGRPWFDPAPETLQAWVTECRVRMDLPPVFESSPYVIPATGSTDLGVAPEEVDDANAALRELHEAWRAEVRALYIEATGDADGGDRLSPTAMASEIEDKALPDEVQRVRQAIARERAGLAQPPADLSQTTPVERYFRGLARLGDDMERLLGDRLGADRARAMRAADGGWGFKSEYAGCPRP